MIKSKADKNCMCLITEELQVTSLVPLLCDGRVLCKYVNLEIYQE